MARPVVETIFVKATCLAWILAAIAPATFGKLSKERRLLRHFNQIEVRGAVKVFVAPEDRLREATVYADDSLLKSVVTEVRGRTLVVEANNVGSYAPRLPFVRIEFKAIHPVEVIVSAKELEGVTVAGEGGFTGTNLRAKTFRVFSAGTGKVHLENLTADEVEVRMESDGDVTLKGGVVERLRANLSGKGSLQAIDLPALRAHVNVAGTGDAAVRAENWLEAKLSGKGNLRYLGRPVNVFVQTNGEGRAERIDPVEEEDAGIPAKDETSPPPAKEQKSPSKKRDQ